MVMAGVGRTICAVSGSSLSEATRWGRVYPAGSLKRARAAAAAIADPLAAEDEAPPSVLQRIVEEAGDELCQCVDSFAS